MSADEHSSLDQNRQRPTWFVSGLVLVALSVVSSIASIWMYSHDTAAITEPLSELVVSQLADAAAPLVLSDNQIGLQALAQKATRDDTVAHAAFYNVRNELMAQAGRASMAGSGLQVRREISMQKRLLGYARLSLTPPQPGIVNTGLLVLVSTALGLLGLGLLVRAVWLSPRANTIERPKSALLEKQVYERDYQQLEEPAGEYGIIAVELLQLPLMRKQLSEDTLYEYLTTFEHWLEQVSVLYAADIRVGETGFTLTLKENEIFDAKGELLVARTTCCAYALMKALNAANRHRSNRSEPVFEARVGAHVSAPMQSDARLLRELYAQDAHRQAWQACVGKAAGTVNLSHSVVAHPECAELQVGAQDANGFYELKGLEPEILQLIDRRVQKIVSSINSPSDGYLDSTVT
ncbi:MAG: hypothetical protein AB8B86_07800 [Pseudomonadales bacterium]